MNDAQTTTGELRYIGRYKLGANPHYDYSQCVDCKSDYPHLRGAPSCNGHRITRCPWCRPDSEPWKNGRGK